MGQQGVTLPLFVASIAAAAALAALLTVRTLGEEMTLRDKQVACQQLGVYSAGWPANATAQLGAVAFASPNDSALASTTTADSAADKQALQPQTAAAVRGGFQGREPSGAAPDHAAAPSGGASTCPPCPDNGRSAADAAPGVAASISMDQAKAQLEDKYKQYIEAKARVDELHRKEMAARPAYHEHFIKELMATWKKEEIEGLAQMQGKSPQEVDPKYDELVAQAKEAGDSASPLFGEIWPSRTEYPAAVKHAAVLRREVMALEQQATGQTQRLDVMSPLTRLELERAGGRSTAVPLLSNPFTSGDMYLDHLNVSFILQYFKHPHNIDRIVDNLFRCFDSPEAESMGLTGELLVNVDNPEEHATWIAAMARTKQFLSPLFSHDLHEIRGYNKLATVARGEIVVFLQDDIIPPTDCTWIQNLVKVYRQWPRLGIVGLQIAMFADAPSGPWLRMDASSTYFKDPEIEVDFQFVSVVDLAPLTARRSVFYELDGFDEHYSPLPGNPGIFLDYDLAMRCWHAGYYVGHMRLPAPFTAGIGDGGTHGRGRGAAMRRIAEQMNNMVYFSRFAPEEREYVYDLVKALNGLLQPTTGDPTPWATAKRQQEEDERRRNEAAQQPAG